MQQSSDNRALLATYTNLLATPPVQAAVSAKASSHHSVKPATLRRDTVSCSHVLLGQGLPSCDGLLWPAQVSWHSHAPLSSSL